jgi:hypothetical protein
VATWYLRQHPKVRALPFKAGVKRQARVNARVRYIEGDMVSVEAMDSGVREGLYGIPHTQRRVFSAGSQPHVTRFSEFRPPFPKPPTPRVFARRRRWSTPSG